MLNWVVESLSPFPFYHPLLYRLTPRLNPWTMSVRKVGPTGWSIPRRIDKILRLPGKGSIPCIPCRSRFNLPPLPDVVTYLFHTIGKRLYPTTRRRDDFEVLAILPRGRPETFSFLTWSPPHRSLSATARRCKLTTRRRDGS